MVGGGWSLYTKRSCQGGGEVKQRVVYIHLRKMSSSILDMSSSFYSIQNNKRNDHDPLKGGGTKSSFEDEYKKICSLKPRYTIGDCAAGK